MPRLDSSIEETNDLQRLVEQAYELNYKYDMVKWARKETPSVKPRYERLSNRMDRLEKTARTVLEPLRDKLLDGFNNWLDSHALTDPEQWVHHAVHEDSYMQEVLWSVESREDIERVAESIRGLVENGRQNEFTLDAVEALETFMEENNDFQTIMRDLVQQEINHFENAGEDEQQRAKEYRDALESENWSMVVELTRPIWQYGDFTNDLPRVLNFVNDHMNEIEPFVESVLAHQGFDHWYDYWYPRGIDQTRERIQTARDELETLRPYDDIEDWFMTINRATQVCHQEKPGQGSDRMLAHGDPNVWPNDEPLSGSRLDDLFEGPDDKWNEDLRGVGIDPGQRSDGSMESTKQGLGR